MSRDWKHYLDDIIESCEKILRYSKGMTFDEFVKDEKTYDAIERNLGIIGEAAKKLPSDYCESIPEVEWRKVTGFRDVLTHTYFRVEKPIVWDVVTNKVPDLLHALTKSKDN